MSHRRRPVRRLVVTAIAVVLGTTLAPSRLAPLARAALVAVANPDTLTTRHDRLATVPAPGVLKNDTNLLGSTTAVFVSGTTHGTVNLAGDGGYTYAPSAGYTGSDQFRYRDSGILTNTTTVTITVTNAAPVARDDSYTAATGVTLSVAAPGVLANDTDADGDQLRASLVDGGGNGSLSLAANGGFTFRSGGSYVGLRTFTYRVSDGVATSGIATVSIDVRPQSATPTPTPTPTPQPTPTPIPTVTLPPIPSPVPIPTLVPVPSSVPIPTLIPTPTLIPIPTPAPSVRPGPSGSPSPTPPGSPGGSSDPTSTAATSGAPVGGGSIGGDPPTQPGGRGPGRAGGFDVGRGGLGPIGGLGDVGVVGLGGLVIWAVPALVLSVPGLLLLLAVLAQAAGALLWLPVARRWLGGFGIRRRRTDRSSA